MNRNNYILSDSPTKTAKANKLKKRDNYLFDFSLLDKTVSNFEYLKDIKQQVMDHMNSIAFHFVPVFKNSDVCTDYDTYYGNLYFKPYPVYSDSKNKQCYIIFQLIKIEHLAFQQRESVYDEYTTVQEINEQIADNDMIEEINIA